MNHLAPDKNVPSEWCPKGRGHLHEYDMLHEEEGVQVERCKLCGQKVHYNKVKGRVDNEKYLRDHRRDFLQSNPDSPSVKMFNEIYGERKRK